MSCVYQNKRVFCLWEKKFIPFLSHTLITTNIIKKTFIPFLHHTNLNHFKMNPIQPILDIQELDYFCQSLMDQTIVLRGKIIIKRWGGDMRVIRIIGLHHWF